MGDGARRGRYGPLDTSRGEYKVVFRKVEGRSVGNGFVSS